MSKFKQRLVHEISILYEKFWERRLGINTAFIKEIRDYSNQVYELKFAQRYQASGYRTLFNVLSYLQKTYNYPMLLDLGCGAGRVLLVAKHIGFPSVQGVEFDSDLVALANQNHKRYQVLHPKKTAKFKVIHESVAYFKLPETPLIIFMFNPFHREIMDDFLKNNLHSFHQHKSMIVCLSPRLGEVICENGFRMIKEWPHSDFNRIIRLYSIENEKDLSKNIQIRP